MKQKQSCRRVPLEATPSGKKSPALALTLPPAPSLVQLGVLYQKGQGFIFCERCKARSEAAWPTLEGGFQKKHTYPRIKGRE